MCNLWPSMWLSLGHYEGLQDKLAQLKDARDALDSLRAEHREKRRREQEEMERQRAIQMAQKLEVLRQQKQVGRGTASAENLVWYSEGVPPGAYQGGKRF